MKLLQGLAMSGVSGNMLIGALLDYGVPFEYLEKQLAKLNLAGYRLVCEKRNKLGITGTYFNVILGEDDHDHAHQREVQCTADEGQFCPKNTHSQTDDEHQSGEKPLQDPGESARRVASCHVISLTTLATSL